MNNKFVYRNVQIYIRIEFYANVNENFVSKGRKFKLNTYPSNVLGNLCKFLPIVVIINIYETKFNV